MSSYQEHRPYDVFLSFRGEETRYGFTSHLHTALTGNNIRTFMDRRLEKGKDLGSEIRLAIEGSLISVVVFSQGFAGSRWCLDELVKIMECHRTIGQVVLPIFYYVEPSHVRHQQDAFGLAFRVLLEKHSAIILSEVAAAWKRALTDAANFAGWHVTRNDYESDVIKKVVDHVLRKQNKAPLPITDFPVGLKSRAQDVIQLLQVQSSRVCVIGIWGMGGSGKTTLAKVIYNQIHRQFEDTSFLANIREAWDTNRGQIDLQEQLLCDILNLKKMKIHSIEWGKAMIMERLRGIKALVVLDDVNKDEQLQALCGSRTWIGLGSVLGCTCT